jgi:hypothetical protein
VALIVSCWYWGNKYPLSYVDKLQRGVERNLKQPHRFMVVTPPAEDADLVNAPGCICRMRMFDAEWQAKNGISPGDKVLNLDIDLIVTGELDALVDRGDDFTILQHINSTNPCPMNGSVWMFRAGTRHDVWSDFSLENYKRFGVPFHAFPDDQGWFDYKFPHAGAYTCEGDGVYGFKKRGWPSGDDLPANARIVAFPGWRDPSKLGHLDWVRQHWR